MKLQRREFLQTLAAGAAALSIPRAAFGQKSSATKLTDKVTLITGAGNNIVVLAGDDGSLLVDCGDAAHAQDVLKLAGRVNTVFNTHWHLESTGANDAMAKAGAKLVVAREHGTVDDAGDHPRLGEKGLSAARQGSAAHGDLLHDGQDDVRR